MEYRFTDTHIIVYLPYPGMQKGKLVSYKLLDRPYKDLQELIINGTTYECDSNSRYEEFKPETSNEFRRIYGGLTFPNNGLERIFNEANKRTR